MSNTLKIGSSTGTLATFASYGISVPVAHPVVPYSDLAQMASGKVVRRGYYQGLLRWPGQLSTAERTALRAIVTSQSTDIVVQVPNEDYDDTIYTCTAIWPERNASNSQIPSFELKLIKLVEVPS